MATCDVLIHEGQRVKKTIGEQFRLRDDTNRRKGIKQEGSEQSKDDGVMLL